MAVNRKSASASLFHVPDDKKFLKAREKELKCAQAAKAEHDKLAREINAAIEGIPATLGTLVLDALGIKDWRKLDLGALVEALKDVEIEELALDCTEPKEYANTYYYKRMCNTLHSPAAESDNDGNKPVEAEAELEPSAAAVNADDAGELEASSTYPTQKSEGDMPSVFMS